MLKKNSPPAFDPKKPWDSDALDRKPAIELLTKLVQSTSQPFVLSVEAPFGYGKTTFLNLWKAHLELEGHICLHFNAWENDFVDDPMIAFLGEMDTALREAGQDKEGFPLATLWDEVKKKGGALIRTGLPLAVQVVTRGALKTEELASVANVLDEHGIELTKEAGEFARKKLKEYESSRQTIKGFREALGKFAAKLAKEEKKKQPIVFFIDELDRCRPDFAVALLERIKHLFQVEGFFFVLGIDRNQLSHSVRVLYGEGMDAEGYLRRFMDFAYSLPAPREDQFAELLFDRFKLHEVFAERRDEYECKKLVLRDFNAWAKRFNLSLRAQEQCFTDLNLLLRTRFSGYAAEIIAGTFLICFRAWKPEKYRQLISGQITYEQMAELIPNNHTHTDGLAEAVAILATPRQSFRIIVNREFTDIQNNMQGDPDKKSRVRKIQELMGGLDHVFPDTSPGITEQLELLSHFRGKHL